MSTLIELEKALRHGDLEAAVVAYEGLTGKKIKRSAKPTVPAGEVPIPPKKAKAKSTKAETAKPAPANRFDPAAADVPKDSFDAKVLPRVVRTPRDRKKVDNNKVQVTCPDCNRTYETEARFLAGRQIDDEDMRAVCDRCVTNRCRRD